LLQLPYFQPLLLFVRGLGQLPPAIIMGLILGAPLGVWLFMMVQEILDAERRRDAARREADWLASRNTLRGKNGSVRDGG
jgi:hypothetical protein